MVIKGAKVYTENHVLEECDIVIKGRRIQHCSNQAAAAADDAVLNVSGLYAIPGLVDIHFHGCLGIELCDADADGIRKIAEYEARNGVLAICPATMSYDEERLKTVMKNARSFREKQCSGWELSWKRLYGLPVRTPPEQSE